jgi:hypothetical protein
MTDEPRAGWCIVDAELDTIVGDVGSHMDIDAEEGD